MSNYFYENQHSINYSSEMIKQFIHFNNTVNLMRYLIKLQFQELNSQGYTTHDNSKNIFGSLHVQHLMSADHSSKENQIEQKDNSNLLQREMENRECHVNSKRPRIEAKLYRCNYEGCGKSYKSKENLTLHVQNKHYGHKPYQCRYCEARFSHRNGIHNLILGKTYHERKNHIKYLPHVCSFEMCKMSFASKSALSYHVNTKH